MKKKNVKIKNNVRFEGGRVIFFLGDAMVGMGNGKSIRFFISFSKREKKNFGRKEFLDD